MKKTLLTLAAFTLVAGGTMASAQVVHRASLGGADICEAFGLPTGCDANFSLVAIEYADGTVKGQWQDTFAGGGEGFHVVVDCLNVDGHWAIVGGVITRGTLGGVDYTGVRALTMVVDQGTSANDPPDLMTFSLTPPWWDTTVPCTEQDPLEVPLFPLTHGQVKVW